MPTVALVWLYLLGAITKVLKKILDLKEDGKDHEKLGSCGETRTLDKQIDLPIWYDINQQIICQFNTNFMFEKSMVLMSNLR